MRTLTVALDAGQTRNFKMSGTYWEIISGAADIDTVEFFDQNDSFQDSFQGVREGIYRNAPFAGFSVTNGATSQTIKILFGSGSGGNRAAPVSGTVNIGNTVEVTQVLGDTFSVAPSPASTPAQVAKNVTNVSANLLAAKADRKYLLIQNKSATGTIWINLAGAAATQANGIRLGPGDSFTQEGNRIIVGAITAIGDIAANPDVITLETV